MLRAVALGVALAVTAAAAPATADPVPEADPDLEPPDRAGLPDASPHLEGGFGVDLGYYSAGADVGLGGLHGLIGVRVDRIAALAEIDGALIGNRQLDAPETNVFGRVAVEARLSLWQGKVREQRRRARFPSIVRAELWIEPGIGYEWASQITGPMLERSDVSLAIGYQTTRHGGFYDGSYFALRIIEARAPATPYDSGTDTSILFTSGMLLGK